jgi:DNA primase
MFDRPTVNQVLQASDIVDIIGEHVSLVKKGKEWLGLCPFHDDHRPSMYVNPTKQIFKCFACGAGGSVFTFLQMRENLAFPQAVERLAQRAGIKIAPTKPTKAGTAPAEDIDPNKLAKINASAAAYFHNNLTRTPDGKPTLRYLAERKITPDSIRTWQLGLALNRPDALLQAARAKGISLKDLTQAGLAVGYQGQTPADKFVNRLIFPIADVTGRIIGFGGRTLDESSAKYINSPTTVLFDKSNCLYGLDKARHQIVATSTALVVEGYTDVIMAHQCGCTNVVATLGTSFTSGHARILRRYAKKIVLIFDSDTAGIEAANRALKVCLEKPIDIKLASIPEAKDPCEFLAASGKEAFQQLADQAVDVFEFKWNRLTESFTDKTPLVNRRAALDEFLEAMATGAAAGNLHAIEKGLIVNKLASLIGLDKKEINTELTRRTERAQRRASANEKNQPQTPDLGQGLFAAAQRELIEILLNEPNLFEMAKEKVSPDVFDVPVLQRIARIIFESLTTQANVELADILARAESVEAGTTIAHLARTGEEKGNYRPRLAAALDVIQRHLNLQIKQDIRDCNHGERLLKHLTQATGKKNPHSLGMT